MKNKTITTVVFVDRDTSKTIESWSGVETFSLKKGDEVRLKVENRNKETWNVEEYDIHGYVDDIGYKYQKSFQFGAVHDQVITVYLQRHGG